MEMTDYFCQTQYLYWKGLYLGIVSKPFISTNAKKSNEYGASTVSDTLNCYHVFPVITLIKFISNTRL